MDFLRDLALPAEAFDKLARFLGLGFPGGPAIDTESDGGDPEAVRFPRALPDRPFDFSFSGLKTAVVTYVRRHHAEGTLPAMADIAASVQEAIVDVLVTKTLNAADEAGVSVVAAGGGFSPIGGYGSDSPRLVEREILACFSRHPPCVPTMER